MQSTDILHRKGPDSHTSESVGKVKDVLTEPGHQAGRNVNASPENPRYEVCSVVLPESSWSLSGLIIDSDNDVWDTDPELEHWQVDHHLRGQHPGACAIEVNTSTKVQSLLASSL